MQGKDAAVVRAMRDRSRKAKTFDFLEPQGRWLSLHEVLAAFAAGRAATLHYVQSTNAALHQQLAPLPGLGLLDGYQWLLLIAAHTERHVRQIEAIRLHPSFPETTS